MNETIELREASRYPAAAAAKMPTMVDGGPLIRPGFFEQKEEIEKEKREKDSANPPNGSPR